MLPCSVHVVSPSKVRNGDKWGKNNITELACVCACVCSMCPCNSSKLEALWSPFMQRQQSVTRTCQSLFLSHTHTELCLKQFRFGNEIHKAHYSQCDSSRNISRPFQLLFFCFFFSFGCVVKRNALLFTEVCTFECQKQSMTYKYLSTQGWTTTSTHTN